MKTIEAYHHKTSRPEQIADSKPGNYYVSVRDGERLGLLAGPFKSHQSALDLVDCATLMARMADPFSAFYSFGTVCMKPEYTKPGILNTRLGI